MAINEDKVEKEVGELYQVIKDRNEKVVVLMLRVTHGILIAAISNKKKGRDVGKERTGRTGDGSLEV
jgi:hypothetical protein